jgi:hypothetical protein
MRKLIDDTRGKMSLSHTVDFFVFLPSPTMSSWIALAFASAICLVTYAVYTTKKTTHTPQDDKSVIASTNGEPGCTPSTEMAVCDVDTSSTYAGECGIVEITDVRSIAGPVGPCGMTGITEVCGTTRIVTTTTTTTITGCVSHQSMIDPATYACYTACDIACDSSTTLCDLCSQSVASSVFALHQRRCAGDHEACLGGCGTFGLRASSEWNSHVSTCVAQADAHLAAIHATIQQERQDMFTQGLLSQAQWDALTHTLASAQVASEAAQERLVQRLERLGFDRHHLRQTFVWFCEHAPLAIHVGFSNPSALLQDTHYRSQFETGTSGGTLCNKSRTIAEQCMFGPSYGDQLALFERCKYGLVNLGADPIGVQAAYVYGSSYLQLDRAQIRARTTFTPEDSLAFYHSGQFVGTYDYMCHVFEEFCDLDLQRVVQCALGELTHWQQPMYTEAQFHGPVRLAQDVELLAVHTTYLNDASLMEMIHACCKKHSIPLIFV